MAPLTPPRITEVWGGGSQGSFPGASIFLPWGQLSPLAPTVDLVLGIPGPVPWVSPGLARVFPHCYGSESPFALLFLVLTLKQAYFHFLHFSQGWKQMLFSFTSEIEVLSFSLFPFYSFFLETSYLLPSPPRMRDSFHLRAFTRSLHIRDQRPRAFSWAKVPRRANLEEPGFWGKPRDPRKSFQTVPSTVAVVIRNNFFCTDLHKTPSNPILNYK